MEDLLGRCEWPPLPPRYDAALREAVAFLIGRFDVSGILACGTIVRGVPDASSDLDLYVLHRGDFMQRLQKFFGGVPTEMFVNPPAQVLRHMEREYGERRPIAAHMVAHGFTVLDLDGVLPKLREMALGYLKGEPEIADERLTYERYTAASLLEDAADVRERDPETAAMILADAVEAMLALPFTQAKAYFPRKKSLLEALAALDPETAETARAFYAAASPDERFERAYRLADRLIGARGFFEWEGAPIKVQG